MKWSGFIVPRTVLELSSPFRRLIGRFFLFFGMLGPGLFFVTSPSLAHLAASLGQIREVPHAVFIMGLLLIFGCILMVGKKTRDFGYICGGVFYSLVTLGAFLSLWSDNPVSPLAFSLPVVVWIYFESSNVASRSRENVKNKDNTVRG